MGSHHSKHRPSPLPKLPLQDHSIITAIPALIPRRFTTPPVSPLLPPRSASMARRRVRRVEIPVLMVTPPTPPGIIVTPPTPGLMDEQQEEPRMLSGERRRLSGRVHTTLRREEVYDQRRWRELNCGDRYFREPFRREREEGRGRPVRRASRGRMSQRVQRSRSGRYLTA